MTRPEVTTEFSTRTESPDRTVSAAVRRGGRGGSSPSTNTHSCYICELVMHLVRNGLKLKDGEEERGEDPFVSGDRPSTIKTVLEMRLIIN